MFSKKTGFEKLLEAVPDALVGMDQKGVIRFVNYQTESLFGFDRDELIGQPITTLVPEVFWQIYADLRDDYFANPATQFSGIGLELTGRQADGTEFPINLAMSRIDTGDLLLVITAVRDVTQRQQAIKDAQLIEAIVEYSHDAIISMTLDGIITNWNPAAERLFGYSSEQVIGTSVAAMSPKDRPEEINGILAKVRAGEPIHHLETNLARRNGKVFPVSLTVSPICDENGAVVGISMISRNMTALRRAAQYARSLIEADPDPLVTISPEGTINDVNEAAVTIIGVPRDELIGTDFSHNFTDPDKAHEIYQQAFAQGSVTDYPLTVRHRNGTLTHVLCNASVYRDFNGEVLGVLAAARDMTKQQEAFEATQGRPPRPG